MKKIYFFAFILITGALSAQITISNADMPKSGDTIRTSYAYSISGEDLTATGANHIWDYSALVAVAQNLEKYEAPDKTPYGLFKYIGASYGQYVFTPDSLPIIGMSPQDLYNFYKNSAADYRQIGIGMTLSGLAAPIPYSAQDVVYKFPLQYGDMDSSNSKYAIPIPGMAYYGQNKKRVNEVDGWGTLNTPFGTFQTIRVKSTLYISDTINLDTLGIGMAIDRPVSYEYKWLSAAEGIPVLQVNANGSTGVPIATYVQYQDSMRGGIPQVGINESNFNEKEYKVYPNPSEGDFSIEYSLNYPAYVSLDVYDLLGKKVYSQYQGTQKAGEHLYKVNQAMPSSVYFIKLSVNDQSFVKRLVVR